MSGGRAGVAPDAADAPTVLASRVAVVPAVAPEAEPRWQAVAARVAPMSSAAPNKRWIMSGIVHAMWHRLFNPAIANFGYGVSIYAAAEHGGLPYGTSRATHIEDDFMRGTRHAAASNGGAAIAFATTT